MIAFFSIIPIPLIYLSSSGFLYGSSNKLLSYWAFGLVVICDSISSYKYIVNKSKGGLISNNQLDWIRNLKLLIKDSNTRDKLRINGKLFIHKRDKK